MKRNILLKILSAVSLGLVGFPLLFSVDVNSFGEISAVRILVYYGILVLVGFLGYCLGKASKKNKLIRIFCKIIGILTFAAGFIALPIGGDVIISAVMGINCVFWFFIGLRCFGKCFADIFPFYFFGIYICLTIVCYFFVSIGSAYEVKDTVLRVLTIFFLIELTSASLLINQSGIFERANRRKETKASLPKGLSGYNAAMAGGAAVILSLLCIFAGNIAEFINSVLLLIAEGFFRLISLFNAEKMGIEESEGGLRPSMGYSSESVDFWQVIAILGFIAIIIVFRKKIISAVKSLLSRIGRFFTKEAEEGTETEFTDYFEDYRSERTKKERPLSLNKLYRLYRNEKDSRKKYRYGYRILIKKIKQHNSALSPSDTTSEQAEKGKTLFAYEELKNVVRYYDNLRYNGGEITENELSVLDTLIGKEA